MPPGKQGGKSKSSTPEQKDRRASSWTRGEKRKDERRKAQAAAQAGNKAHRAAGELTPWEQACAVRRQRRVALTGGRKS
jgi:hypothetical protein